MTLGSPVVPDWAKLFVDSCICARRRSGKLAMGGMITFIAESLGVVTLPEYEPFDSFLYDEAALVASDRLTKEGRQYVWWAGGSQSRH